MITSIALMYNLEFILFLKAIRREFTRRAKSDSAEMAKKMEGAEKILEEQRVDQKAITAGRNYIL